MKAAATEGARTNAGARPILFPSGKLPWLKPSVFVGALAPLAAIAIRGYRGSLGANPIERALNQVGLLALVFLVASLACTPLKTAFGFTWPIRVRKMLGLYAFFYASLHFFIYVVLDRGLDLAALGKDIGKRPFIVVGVFALVLLVPLAVTSTAKMVKRLGFARWKRLHKLAYLAAALGVVHFFLRVKKDVSEPLVYGAILGVLFAVRIGSALLERRAPRAP
jgi:methionine sulfoxide reductase heme-binding subunit